MRKSQKSRIWAYLKSGKSITTYQSFVKFRCTNLPKRICELIHDGHSVQKLWKKTRHGRVREYYL